MVKWSVNQAGCNVWSGSTNKDGYGSFGGKRAHRWLYQQVHRLTDDQMPEEVMHTCDNPPCVNERHLMPGTHQDNMADMTNKDRRASKLTASQVREIRESPMQSQAMARLYGVSESTMSRVRACKTWQVSVES